MNDDTHNFHFYGFSAIVTNKHAESVMLWLIARSEVRKQK